MFELKIIPNSNMQTLYVIIIVKNTLEYSIHDFLIFPHTIPKLLYPQSTKDLFTFSFYMYILFHFEFSFIIPVKILLNSIQMKMIKVFIKNTEN